MPPFRPQTLSRATVLCLGICSVQPSISATHDFCVTRMEIAGPQSSRARIYFNAEDPGREAAGHLLIQHYRSRGAPAVRIDEESSAACTHSDTQHIALNETGNQRRAAVDAGIPNLGRVANLASHALTGIAEDASRLMCRLLPC